MMASPTISATVKPDARAPLRPVVRNMLFLMAAFAVLCVALEIVAPNFGTAANLKNILRQMSLIGIIGVGMTMVIVAGEIDLSVGSIAALSGVGSAYLATRMGFPPVLAILLVIVGGIAGGSLTGILRTWLLVPSFITSLALLTSARSGGFLISGGFPVAPVPQIFDELGNGERMGVPVSVLVMGCAFLTGHILLTRSTWGRSIYAVGGNEEASRLSGINVAAIKISVLAVNGMLSALAGVILAGRLDSGAPTVAVGWELDIIAAVIIGGTSLFGGTGSVVGTLLGTLFMATLRNGMVLMGVSPYSQGFVSGVVILLAVVAGSLQNRRR
jgi:ribose/xylose/arabinose/galactoside ABC-type transport system permease subunit